MRVVEALESFPQLYGLHVFESEEGPELFCDLRELLGFLVAVLQSHGAIHD